MNKIRRDLYYDFKAMTSCFKALTSGIRKSALVRNCRLRSLPHKLVLKLPTTTPSGFSMGTTLKTTFFLSSLASSELEQMKYRNPFIIWLPHVSPGWILPEIIMHLLVLSSTSGSVMVSKGTSRPPRVSHRYYYLRKSKLYLKYVRSILMCFQPFLPSAKQPCSKYGYM